MKIGYKLSRHDCNGWLFGGTTPKEVAECLQNELDSHEGLSVEECDVITIEAFEITQKEIDDMPEFQGW